MCGRKYFHGTFAWIKRKHIEKHFDESDILKYTFIEPTEIRTSRSGMGSERNIENRFQ